ncbi:MAG TPA: putative glycoside hydrolase [Chthonomonas sp.]|uniref:putative glycoside hydrolase n=1 Tax=Chthonomonas sp. TaxID=2282153 RepID=UPI002B4B26E2|nr:putative glycoside hydrolase [Chthonomonas sp.]HLI47873.1 putative glycoside hydrolase [Chthonomonas sp.]
MLRQYASMQAQSTRRTFCACLFGGLLLLGLTYEAPFSQNTAQAQNGFQPLTPVRSACPVRLGGVFTMGLGTARDSLEASAQNGTKLSPDNAKWIGDNCDVVAISPNCLEPNTYPAIRKEHPLFSPLLYVYASCLSENPNAEGNVGGWTPTMEAHVLTDAKGKEIPYPTPGGHWMDFGSIAWAHVWRDRVLQLVSQYGADGVVAAELPINNTFLPETPGKYPNFAARAEATLRWLQAARAKGRFFMVPEALGFDRPAGHPTLPPPLQADAPALKNRLWDDYFPYIDGAWVEDWVEPYWTGKPLSESEWERQQEAAERYSLNTLFFIAAGAYHNPAELEYALASFLLIEHRQGRIAFQPMPLYPGQRNDAGFSLRIMRHEVEHYSNYFNVPLGLPLQERHKVPTTGGMVWRRTFQNGAVYVNPSDTRTVTLNFGSPMRRLNNRLVRKIVLPPHSGAILLYQPPGD